MAHPFHPNKESAMREGKRTKKISGDFQFGIDRSFGRKMAKNAKHEAIAKRTSSTSKHQPYLDEKNRGGKFQ